MVNWSKTAFTFPGQGSQAIGMGRDFADAYPVARQTFEEADDLLGYALSDLCFNGPAAQLDETANTQPALYVTSIAILRTLQNEAPEAVPGFVAGHSLGELTALTAAGSLPFSDGIRVVHERGRLMAEAGKKKPGAMAALLGMARESVEHLCMEASENIGAPVILANDNCPGQIVISGDSAALDMAMELAALRGARKVVRLAVSIAAHSPLMQSAADSFRSVLESAHISAPQIPVYSNATAAPITNAGEIPAIIGGQLTSPVRWTESMQAMIADGAEQFVEIGPGDVLTGMVKRLDREIKRTSMNSVEALAALLEA